MCVCVCVSMQLISLVPQDIQRLCHFSPSCEAHKRNSLGNDGHIKENGSTNPDSIMEKTGDTALPMVVTLFGFDWINLLLVLIFRMGCVQVYLQ